MSGAGHWRSVARSASVVAASVALSTACGGAPTAPVATGALHPLALTVASDDPFGAWAQLQTTTTTTDAGIAGTITTTNHRVLLLRLEPVGDDEDIRMHGVVCDAWVENSTSMASTELPEAFIETFPAVEYTGALDRADRAPTLRIDPAVELLGLAPGNPDGPLPTGADDPAAADTDGDGHPGVTIRVTGFGGGDMYFAQRTRRTLEVTRFEGPFLDGVISWAAERVVLDATSRTLRNAREAIPTDDPAQNWFRSTRVPDDATCAQVVEAGMALFAR